MSGAAGRRYRVTATAASPPCARRCCTAPRARGRPEGLRPFWAFGAGSLGPPLAAFADWVVEQARDAGCSRAFCLMREGQLLAALVNQARGQAGPVAEPLWLSRQVCARASIVEGTRRELEALFVRRRLPTLAEYKATRWAWPAPTCRSWPSTGTGGWTTPALATR